MISRTVNLLNILKEKSSGLMLGPRGVGKTRLAERWLQSQSESLSYNFLDTSEYRRLLDNPARLLNEVETKLKTCKSVLSVFIDEVQKIPSILDICHLLIEKHKGKVRFLLTGSSARKLKSSGVNLLAGRALSLRLHPLTFQELSGGAQGFDLTSALRFGTIPGIIFSEDPALALRAYVDTYLKEEIQQEAIVRKLDKFFRFIDLAAQLNGEPINFSKFARQLSISDKSVADYFQILVDTLLVIQLPGWDRSIKKQVIKSSKFYFFDCGVLNAAAKELGAELVPGSSRFGRLFEQFVINEFYRMNDYYLSDYTLSYYSTGKAEVDLVLSKGRGASPLAIEIKSAANIFVEDLTGLQIFSEEYPQAKLYCVCTASKAYTLKLSSGGEVLVLPYNEAVRTILSLN